MGKTFNQGLLYSAYRVVVPLPFERVVWRCLGNGL